MTTSAKCAPPDSRTRSRLSSTGGSSASIAARAASSASDRRLIHEHVDVAAEQAHGSRDDESRDEERGDRVAFGKAERRRREAGEHGERSGEIAPEVERVREQRVAAVATCGAQRDRRPHRVDREHEPDRREGPPGRVDLGLDRAGQARDGQSADHDADEDQERGLGERRQVLGLPMPPRMSGVGRPHGDRDGEEREQRGREIRARVRSLRQQPEAPAREPRRQLDRDQQARGPDRHERGAPLR